MDPISAAVLAAVAAGAGKVAGSAIDDAYNGFKSLLARKFGGEDNPVARAVQDVERRPESAGRQQILTEEVTAAKANEDPELVEAAQVLLETIKKSRADGEQIVQNAQNAVGNYIAQASGGSTATVSVNQAKDQR